MSQDFNIEAEMSTGHIMTSYGYNGNPSVSFEIDHLFDGRFTADEIRQMIHPEGLGDLGGGYATDKLAHEVEFGGHEEISDLFEFINAASDVGVDVGGFDVTIKDREAFIAHLVENRPEVFTDELLEEMSEDLRDFYESHSS